jgi:hypothetical protein
MGSKRTSIVAGAMGRLLRCTLGISMVRGFSPGLICSIRLR